MLTSEQVKAARAMLRMDKRDLATKSGFPLDTIRQIERTPGPILARFTVIALEMALEAAGIEFTRAPSLGVRLRIVDVWAGQKDGDGEWVVLTRWGADDPIEWFPIDVARIAAARADDAGDRRLAEMLRVAVAEVERNSRTT